MNEKRARNIEKQSFSGIFLWAGTVASVLLILGGSLWIARTRPASPPPPSQSATEAPRKDETRKETPSPASSAPAETPIRNEESAARMPETRDGPAIPIPAPRKRAGTLQLHAAFMAERNKIPLAHTCFRENASPALSWEGAPRGTKSYILLMQKAQADYQGPLNWVVFDIPAAAAGLPEKQPKSLSLPGGGKQARNEAGSPGYNGPCESSGVFRYSLRLFALDTVLDLPAEAASRQTLIRAMDGHILDEAAVEFDHYYKM